MGKIKTESIKYIKNVNHLDHKKKWAYDQDKQIGAYFRLNFKNGDGVENHVLNLPKSAYIILSQRPTDGNQRYLTHVVELVNEGTEDQAQWESGEWGIFRWVKIHWVADLDQRDRIPVDEDVMQANWGYFDTKAKKLDSSALMTKWGDIKTLRAELEKVFN